MSKVAITGNASGSATFTIAAPNSSTNHTLTLPDNSGTVQTELTNGFGFRNRIINGDMRIDQRNAGAAVALTSGGAYAVDRWNTYEDTDAALSIQQVSEAPAGFTTSLKVTVTTADASIGASQFTVTRQFIEGYNISDLGWGSASAQAVTLSFWVRSSLTGTFGGVFHNGAHNRSYPFTYSISAANTWEQKTVTIAGDTTGTWLTTNGVGLGVQFGLGVGSTYSGTAGAWAGATYFSATGSTSVVSTLSATWQITGVQLEAGSVATPFERRPYGTELALCQRYFQSLTASGRYYTSDGAWGLQYAFKVTMRATPTYSDTAGSGIVVLPSTNQGVISGSTQEAGVQWSGSGAGTFYAYARAATFNSEL